MAVELLDFYADWCGPCKIMEPILEEVEKDLAGKITVRKINVDEEVEVTSQYGVMSIPTYLVLKDGQEVDRFVGAQPKENLLGKIQSQLT